MFTFRKILVTAASAAVAVGATVAGTSAHPTHDGSGKEAGLTACARR